MLQDAIRRAQRPHASDHTLAKWGDSSNEPRNQPENALAIVADQLRD